MKDRRAGEYVLRGREEIGLLRAPKTERRIKSFEVRARDGVTGAKWLKQLQFILQPEEKTLLTAACRLDPRDASVACLCGGDNNKGRERRGQSGVSGARPDNYQSRASCSASAWPRPRPRPRPCIVRVMDWNDNWNGRRTRRRRR